MLGPSFLQLRSCLNRIGKSCLAALCGKAGRAVLGELDSSFRVRINRSVSNPYLTTKTFILDRFFPRSCWHKSSCHGISCIREWLAVVLCKLLIPPIYLFVREKKLYVIIHLNLKLT